MTFRAWLMKRTKDESPIGDLARDVKSDREIDHRVVNSREKWEGYLDRCGACYDAFDALRSAWDRYEVSEQYK